jgi:hypothetical protein
MVARKNVEKAEENAVVNVPVIDFANDAGSGLEGADKDSFAIPFVRVLQGLSPALEEIEGAKPGHFFNTVTKELWSDGVSVIPVSFQRRFLKWLPRSAGGGFKGEMSVGEFTALGAAGSLGEDERGLPMHDGCVLRDTRTHFVLVVREDGSYTPAIIALSGTQIKKSKLWLSMINELKMRDKAGVPFTPASYAAVYRLTTKKEQNDQGTWHGVNVVMERTINPADAGDAELYMAAREFHKQVSAGAVKVDHNAMADETAAGDDNGPADGF